MFPRRERLPRAKFPTVLTTGRRFSSPHFAIIVSKEAKGYAVVVSKKAARLASDRHRIKRRVLAALKTLPLPPALVIFPKSSAGSVNYHDAKTEIAGILSKINEHHTI